MIQRIQSVWLLLAGIINALLFYFCLFKAHELINNVDTITYVRINDRFPLMMLALACIVLPIATIFNFKKRKQQRTMVFFCLLANISFITTALMQVGNYTNKTPVPTNGSYGAGIVLPVIAIIFLIMAIRGINKDEKLVRAADRLR